jgi:hypothetical protein
METWQRSGERSLPLGQALDERTRPGDSAGDPEERSTEGSSVNRRAPWSLGGSAARSHPIPRFLLCRLLWTSLKSFSLYFYVVLIRLIAIRFSEALVGFSCIYFTVVKFMAYNTDTTNLSNAFFALLGPLALLAFAFANTLDKRDVAREKLEIAGARSFHGAVLLMWASVLKYALLHIKSLPWVGAGSTAGFALDLTLGVMAGILFLLAAVESFAALRSVSDLLVIRLLDEPILLKLNDRKESV